MLVDSSNSTAGSAVTGAIRQAAQVTGTSFQYLLATAQVESGLNPQAGASTSSARGLFQFVEQTWLGTIKQAGPSLGYGQYAAAITQTASGRYEVQDPAMRSEILKLRNDPTTNAVMAGAFTQANAALLQQRLGRSPSEGELYIAHFLGAGGAGRLISAAASDPNASAASYFPNAAQANRSIFYDRSTDAARSLAQVRDILTARYDVATRVRPSGTAQAANVPSTSSTLPSISAVPVSSASMTTGATAASATVASAAVPDTAGMTNAFAAAAPNLRARDNEIFHGLFQDPGRTGPIAEVVSQLWGVSGPASGPNGTPTSGAMLDLFKDGGDRGT
jgi:Transglycosylase SLT domain